MRKQQIFVYILHSYSLHKYSYTFEYNMYTSFFVCITDSWTCFIFLIGHKITSHSNDKRFLDEKREMRENRI